MSRSDIAENQAKANIEPPPENVQKIKAKIPATSELPPEMEGINNR